MAASRGYRAVSSRSDAIHTWICPGSAVISACVCRGHGGQHQPSHHRHPDPRDQQRRQHAHHPRHAEAVLHEVDDGAQVQREERRDEQQQQHLRHAVHERQQQHGEHRRDEHGERRRTGRGRSALGVRPCVGTRKNRGAGALPPPRNVSNNSAKCQVPSAKYTCGIAEIGNRVSGRAPVSAEADSVSCSREFIRFPPQTHPLPRMNRRPPETARPRTLVPSRIPACTSVTAAVQRVDLRGEVAVVHHAGRGRPAPAWRRAGGGSGGGGPKGRALLRRVRVAVVVQQLGVGDGGVRGRAARRRAGAQRQRAPAPCPAAPARRRPRRRGEGQAPSSASSPAAGTRCPRCRCWLSSALNCFSSGSPDSSSLTSAAARASRSVCSIFCAIRSNVSNADVSLRPAMVSWMRRCACARFCLATSRFFLRCASSILTCSWRRASFTFSVSAAWRVHVSCRVWARCGVLLLAQQRLAGQVVAALLQGQHGAALPLLRLLGLALHLRLELALLGDGERPPPAWPWSAARACR